MTAAWSQCTLGALVLMDDSSAARCHCLQDHFPIAPQAGVCLDRRTCSVGGWMETWSQWLNEPLCMMEGLAGRSRGLEVVDVRLAYPEDKVYCFTERARSCWCMWLICFSIELVCFLWCFTVILWVLLQFCDINKTKVEIRFMILLCHVDVGNILKLNPYKI